MKRGLLLFMILAGLSAAIVMPLIGPRPVRQSHDTPATIRQPEVYPTPEPVMTPLQSVRTTSGTGVYVNGHEQTEELLLELQRATGVWLQPGSYSLSDGILYNAMSQPVVIFANAGMNRTVPTPTVESLSGAHRGGIFGSTSILFGPDGVYVSTHD